MTNPSVWEDHEWAGLPILDGDIETDLCVVGLGGSGLAAVREGLRLGLRVVGIEAGRVADGAAGRNGGLLLAGMADLYHDAVTRFGRERCALLYRRTLIELDRMEEETPDAIRRTGSLRIAVESDETDDCIAHLHAMRADGLPVEEYQGPGGHGLLFPRNAVLNPLQRCRTLAEEAIADGAQLFECTAASSVATGVVTTVTGSIRCRTVIVAIDGGLDRLLPEAREWVRNVRLQMLATEPTTEIRLPRPVYARYGYDYWQQLPDGRIAIGGWRDRTIHTEWTDQPVVTEAVQNGLEGLLRKRLNVHAGISARWAAIVGFTADGLPMIRQFYPGVWAIGGYCGTGNILGTLCGRGIVQYAHTGHSDLLTGLEVHG